MLILGGTVIDPDGERQGKLNIRTRNGRIAAVGAGLRPTEGEQVVEAQGCLVTPGLVDIHVHFRDPGYTDKEDLASGSRAAAAGGFCTVVCMANTRPVLDTADKIGDFYRQARARAQVRLYTVGSVTAGLEGETLTDFKALKAAGAVGFSDDGNPVQSAVLMRRALEAAGSLGLPVVSHCGDTSLIADAILHEGPVARQLGFEGMPAEAEDIQVARDVLLAGLTGHHIHIQHVSSGTSVQIIRQAKEKGIPVTAEATPHHFSLTAAALLQADTDAKMNPPLRTAADVEAVRQGLIDGTLDAIATDHAPHTPADKALGLLHAPCGVVGLETCLGLVWSELVRPGLLTPAQAVAKLTSVPARIMGLGPRRLSPGDPADITVFDPEASWTVEPDRFFSRSRNTPFAGRRLQGQVVATVVGGQLIFHRGQILSDPQ